MQRSAGRAAEALPGGEGAARRDGGAGRVGARGDGQHDVPPRDSRGLGVPALPGLQGSAGEARLRRGGPFAAAEPRVAAR